MKKPANSFKSAGKTNITQDLRAPARQTSWLGFDVGSKLMAGSLKGSETAPPMPPMD